MIKLLHKNNKTKMLLSRILNLTLMFTLIATIVFANGSSSDDTVSDVVNNINNGSGVYETIRQIISILSLLGFVIALFKLMQIGILFLMNAGKSKSDAKASLIPWLVGAIVCIMFGTIGPWVINLIMGANTGGVFDI